MVGQPIAFVAGDDARPLARLAVVDGILADHPHAIGAVFDVFHVQNASP